MSLSRCLFVRALAATPVIGNAMAKAGVSGPVHTAWDLGQSGALAGGAGMAQQAVKGYPSLKAADAGSYYAERIADLVKQLAGLGSNREREINERARLVSRLDPDLAGNRSLALHVKMRIQAARDVDRDYAQRRFWCQREIDDLREKQSNFLGL